MEKRYYITTPIYYPSDKLHIGHSYCTVATDALARYRRMQGYDVMFLTGTDEHGQKIETRAHEAGVSPQQYVDRIVAGIKQLWQLMNISNDRFIRTTDDYHVESVQHIFRKLFEKGDIYKSTYKGNYCTPCEAFWTDSQLKDGKCPDCGREVKLAEEEAYFFRLSRYQDRLLQLYDENPGFIEPISRKNELVNNFLRPGLDDLCVSRTSFKWGVPVDFDDKHIVYVWVDALSNYITALGYGNNRYHDFNRYWPADVHIVGKEITRFHAIIWPALLMALELPLPKKVYGHGWLLLEGGKMSKSRGNVIDPVTLCQRYGVDAIRYFLLREFPFGTDGVFSNELLINRINADLANDLGNLVSRTISMIDRYFDGKLPKERQPLPADDEYLALVTGLRQRYEEQMDQFALQGGLVEIFKVISRSNKYIDENTPWALSKNEEDRPRLASVLYNLLDSVRICAILLSPFMPKTSEDILLQIGAGPDVCRYDDAIRVGALPANATVQRGENLFPRIDLATELAYLESTGSGSVASALDQAVPPISEAPAASAVPEEKDEISYEQFMSVELRVAEVLSCEPVPKSDKLLLLQLDDGSGADHPRQIVSGIAKCYSPEQLLGKKIVLVANLKPAKLRGVESSGMLLASGEGDDIQVLFVDTRAHNGDRVR